MTEKHTSYAQLAVPQILAPEGQVSNVQTPTANLLDEESLPFLVRVVRNPVDLDKAVRIRHAAYARHVPFLAEKLQEPEDTDFEEGVVVLLAESKLDGSALGTMRIQTNRFRPLCLESSVELPAELQGASLAEATRLGIVSERVGTLVKTVLFKAYFLYCQQEGIEWMVITARSPIDRQYERLLFTDIYPGMGYIPIVNTGNIPHRIMSLKVPDAESLWAEAKHPMFNFFFRTHHPDIDVGQPVVQLPFFPDRSLYAVARGAPF